MPKKRLFTLILQLIGIIGLIVAVVFYFNDADTYFRIAFVGAILINLAAILVTWKDDRENVERLNAVKRRPNPSVEEIKEYREQHPEKSLAEAVADLKEGIQR